MNTKLVRRYAQSHLAFIHKGVLEENGIDAFVFGENFMNTFPNMYGILHAGIELRVREADYEKAVSLLKTEDEETVCCPNCGSADMVYGFGKKGFAEILFSVLSVLVWTPFGNIKRQYYCKNCGLKSH